jgi:hypothetical protein
MQELGSSKPVSKVNLTQYSGRPVQKTKTGVMRYPAIVYLRHANNFVLADASAASTWRPSEVDGCSGRWYA